MKRETASARLCIFVAIESDPRAADTDAPLSSTNSFISEGQPAEWTAAPRAPCESELSGTSRAENRYLVPRLDTAFAGSRLWFRQHGRFPWMRYSLLSLL